MTYLLFRNNFNALLIFHYQIVSVVLENYGSPSKESNDQEAHETEVHNSASPEILMKVPSWRMIVNDNGEVNLTE